MRSLGATLRTIRLQSGLSLRDVRDRSTALAQEWGSSIYEISGSWLARLESGTHEMTVPKLIALATIYRERPEELLRHCHPGQSKLEQAEKENITQSSERGLELDQPGRQLLPENFGLESIPEETKLLPLEGQLSCSYRRAIVGRQDRVLEPMIRPGSVLKVDTQKRIIAPRKEWTNEFDRPIYLLLTRTSYLCSWCELDKDGTWLTLVSHPLSHEPCQRWRYKKEVEVIGRVVAVAICLGT
jgi:transcriptional regulator with XRE-family HTH domain